MKKTTIKRIIPTLLALIMMVSMIPCMVSATESITVKTSLQMADEFYIQKQDMMVEPGLAGQYGYTYASGIGASEVTVLDALVAAHIMLLGVDDKETINTALVVSSSGSVTTAFAEETPYFGFAVNADMPHSDIWIPTPGFEAYIAYSVNEAVIGAGDDIEFFFFTEDAWGFDYYSWFERDGAKTTSMTVAVDEELELELLGYMYMFYGASGDVIKANKTEAIKDAIVGIVNPATGKIEQHGDAQTDSGGKVTIKFDAPGTYILSAVGDEDMPVIAQKQRR